MPSIASHMVIASLVSKKLKIKNPDFVIGNILPDIINNKDSHHKIDGKYLLIPDVNYFKEKLNLFNMKDVGYYAHILLDKYYLEDYLIPIILKYNDFDYKIMYNDYDKINYLLVCKFDLNTKYIINLLRNYNLNIDKVKLETNIKFLLNKNSGTLKYIDINSYLIFLKKTAQKISKEIKNYASKSGL